MQGTKDTAGVIAPPPLLALATIILGLLLDWLLPAYVLNVFLSGTVRTILGVAFIGAGLALVIAANIVFRTAGTHPEPWKPSTALVTDGIFAWLRNPMYVGFLLVLTGWAMWLSHPLPFLFLPVFVAYMNRFQISPEERVLSAKFGEAYDIYKQSVRRWL